LSDTVPDTFETPKRILVFGATGTIGRATVRALLHRGYDVTCFVRSSAHLPSDLQGRSRFGDVTKIQSILDDGVCGDRFDAVVSCMASRSGSQEDAWAIDYQAHINVLEAARSAGVEQFVLLSAICVQKPRLAFQHAKLAFEKALIESGLCYSIVRPTAFFKSLSGQVERVQKGEAFLVFGDGTLTACKPISDDDLANYLADCVEKTELQNAILPIGGPGEAITPLEQGQMLFELLGREPRFKHVPVQLLDYIIKALDISGYLIPAARKKAQLARIGRYYATESMLLWNERSGGYDANSTPATGSETLRSYYGSLISGTRQAERGEHAVF
jgi:divinyl chlorophyllide a 8-vinyl-reductase